MVTENKNKLTHLNTIGESHMVNVGQKAYSDRIAIAQTKIKMNKETLAAIEQNVIKKGDVLAVVESNESLKSYSITSPFDGNVIARHANNGELSNGQVLFSLANYKDVWAQLTVFSQHLGKNKVGQAVELRHANFEQLSEIAYLTPSADGSPHSLAMLLLTIAVAIGH